MVLTPRFILSQTAATVTLAISIPHIRVSSSTIEIVVDGETFHFHSKPYLLRLTFPGRLIDEDDSGGDGGAGETGRAVYDPMKENGTLTVTLRKEEETWWKDLDLLGRLAASTSDAPSMSRGGDGAGDGGGRGIEVLSSTVSAKGGDDDSCNKATPVEALHPLKPHYGFLSLHCSVFADLTQSGLAAEMLELPDPDETDASERRPMRLKTEEEMFDADRYLGDLYLEGDVIYEEAMGFQAHWETETEGRKGSVAPEKSSMGDGDISNITMGVSNLLSNEDGAADSVPYFTEHENILLATIHPLLPLSVPPSQTNSLLLGLLDLLFSYAYDHRTTCGEPTVESSWTISILSPTLSWLESYTPYDTIAETLAWCLRRSLVYPYLRNYEFSMKIASDASIILQNGRRCVLRCLLQLCQTLKKSETRYLGNRLYIEPYLGWIQRLNGGVVQKFGREVEKVLKLGSVGKKILGLNLLELEEKEESEDRCSSKGEEEQGDYYESSSTTSSEDSSRSSSSST